MSELGIYLLISWYNTERMTKWFEPNQMRYDFYQAPHPWGPWKPAGSVTDQFLGPPYHMYGPSICARFQQRRGANVEVTMFTAGCPFDDVPASPYKMWAIPLVLRTTPLPPPVLVPAADPQIKYKGLWFHWTTTSGDDDRLPRATQTKGSSAELTFSGTGIDYMAARSFDQGTAEIFLDEIRQASVSLQLDDFPVLLGVSVFSRQGLPKGRHTLRIANAGESPINLAGFRVYA